jgi:hypothetical protein
MLWACAERRPFQKLIMLSDVSTEDFMIFLANAKIVFRMGHDFLLSHFFKSVILFFFPTQIIFFLFIL